MNFFNFIRSIIVKIGAVAKFSSSMCMKGPMSTSSFNINSFNFWILSLIHSRIILTDFSVFEAYIGYIELIIISIDKLSNVWKNHWITFHQNTDFILIVLVVYSWGQFDKQLTESSTLKQESACILWSFHG